jgi:GTP-binding protein EngB required for normal cell division
MSRPSTSPLSEAALSAALSVDRQRLLSQAVRLRQLEVGAGVKKRYRRPDSINVLLVGSSGAGKSTFFNFSQAFYHLAAGEVNWGYAAVAKTGSKGQCTEALAWNSVADGKLLISDTRGYLHLSETVQQAIEDLALSHEQKSMKAMETTKMETSGSFWEGANASHHAVLFFLNAENGNATFDVAAHEDVARMLYNLQKNGFQPLVVISKIDKAKSPEALQAYRRDVYRCLTGWRKKSTSLFRKRDGQLNIADEHILEISNICDDAQWYNATESKDVEDWRRFYKQGAAALDVLEVAARYGNKYILEHPQVGAAVLAFTVYISSLISKKTEDDDSAKNAEKQHTPVKHRLAYDSD